MQDSLKVIDPRGSHMNIFKPDLRDQRSILWLSIVMACVYAYGLVGLMRFIPPPSPALNAQQVVELYAGHQLQFQVGVILMLITGSWFALQCAVIMTQMSKDKRCTSGWWLLFGMTSIFQTLVLSCTPLIFGVAAFSVDRPPELTKLMHEFGWLFFATTVCWWPFTMLPIIVTSLRGDAPEHSAFPRWFGWSTLWFLIITEPGVIAIIFKVGPFAWDGLFPFWLPFGLYGPWLVLMLYCMFRAIRQQERSGIQPDTRVEFKGSAELLARKAPG